MDDGTTNTRSEEDDERRLSALLASAEGDAPLELAAAARRQGDRTRARRTTVSAVLAFLVVIAAGGVALRYGGSGDQAGPAPVGAVDAVPGPQDRTLLSASPIPCGTTTAPAQPQPGQGTPCAAYAQSTPPAAAPDGVGAPLGTVSIQFGSQGDTRQWQLREGTAVEALDGTIVGHYPGTAMPGQSGNFALALKAGAGEEAAEAVVAANKVTVSVTGRSYVYQIDARSVVGSNTTGVVAPIPQGSPYTGPGAYLTIVTQVPGETKTLRTVVWGHLTEVLPG